MVVDRGGALVGRPKGPFHQSSPSNPGQAAV